MRYPDAVADAYLKDGNFSTKPFCGIQLSDVKGYLNGGGVVIGSAGSFGNDNRTTNVFDNLTNGVYAENANVSLRNCTFQKIIDQGVRSDGDIGSEIDLPGQENPPIGQFPGNDPNIFAAADYYVDASDLPANAFFNNIAAMYVTKHTRVNFSNCIVRSTHQRNITTNGSGENGIVLMSNRVVDYQIDNNEFSNIANAIWFNSTRGTKPEYHNMAVTNNIINKWCHFNPIAGSYMQHAITINVDQKGRLVGNGAIEVSNNKIKDAEFGITLSGWQGKNVWVTNNQIRLEDTTTNPNIEHWGISLKGGWGASASNNTTNGGLKGDNVVAHNQVEGMSTNLTTGILLEQQANTTVECNTVYGHEHGIRFKGFSSPTKMWNNDFIGGLNSLNAFGLTLDQAQIGLQGSIASGNKGRTCTSDNFWGDPIWYNNMSGPFMTNCIKSDPTNSPLMVNSTAAGYNPDGNGLYSTGSPYPYQHSSIAAQNSLIYAFSQADCRRCGNKVNIPINGEEPADYALLGQIADGSINVPNDDVSDRVYVMQQQLYELLQQHPNIAANHPNLQQFISSNSLSSLDFIYYTAHYLAQGDTATVNLLLGYWPGQSNVDDAYYQYYSWLLQIAKQPNWQPNAALVRELANKCPLKYGLVVYHARNMYDAMTNRINDYPNNCNTGQARGMRNDVKKPVKINSPINSQFTMYPNPANNKVSIVSSLKINQIEIIDMMGKMVLIKNNINNIAVTLDNLQLNKGVYVVKTNFSNNTTATQKLIIE